MKKRVLVAMSGGVDSSAACLVLKAKGYECIGATLKMWPREDCKASQDEKLCCSLDAISYAKSVADKLGMPHYVFDFSGHFKERIKKYFMEEYKKGRTPNPCVYCNSELKFGLLLDKAKALGCDFIASGHYARSCDGTLKRGRDKAKDQSYFLFNLNKGQLKHIIFPLGGMKKEDVKKAAKKARLKSWNKLSSQDICFKVDKKPQNKGKIIFTDGRVMGTHKGIIHYTIGQRKGLGIGYKEPLYVTGLDAGKNIVYAGVKKDTYKKSLIADNMNWISGYIPNMPLKIKAKIRYGSKAALATVRAISKDEIEVMFKNPQPSPAPGQAVVFYKGDTVLGGAWIREIL